MLSSHFGLMNVNWHQCESIPMPIELVMDKTSQSRKGRACEVQNEYEALCVEFVSGPTIMGNSHTTG